MFGRRPNSNQTRICVLGFSANRVWLVSRFYNFQLPSIVSDHRRWLIDADWRRFDDTLHLNTHTYFIWTPPTSVHNHFGLRAEMVIHFGPRPLRSWPFRLIMKISWPLRFMIRSVHGYFGPWPDWSMTSSVFPLCKTDDWDFILPTYACRIDDTVAALEMRYSESGDRRNYVAKSSLTTSLQRREVNLCCRLRNKQMMKGLINKIYDLYFRNRQRTYEISDFL